MDNIINLINSKSHNEIPAKTNNAKHYEVCKCIIVKMHNSTKE